MHNKKTYLYILIFFLSFSTGNALVTFEEILKRPNDLNLNLQYAKEQEDLSNYKAVISTLERLTSLYPENIDLKLYYLSISLRLDSIDRTIKIIDEIKKSNEITPDITSEVELILSTLNKNQTTTRDKPKKWNGYVDLGVNHTYNTNINNLSNSRTFYISDSLSNYAIDEVENDTLEISSIRIGAYKNLSENSNINFNVGLADTYQNKDNSEEQDLNSIFINYNYFTNRNITGATFNYNKSNYRNQADIYSYSLNLTNKFAINNNHFILGGINSSFNRYNQNETFLTTRQKNNDIFGIKAGYEYIFLEKNKLILNYDLKDINSIADYYGYDQEIYSIGLERNLGFAVLRVNSSAANNEYKKADTFVLTNTIRDDEIKTNSISLNGSLDKINLLQEIKLLNNIFYSLSFSKIDSNSNIINYDYEKEIYSVGVTKRINFWKKYLLF